MASSTPCFQPKPGFPIPSGLANAAISAATTPTRTTTIPICLLDMAREISWTRTVQGLRGKGGRRSADLGYELGGEPLLDVALAQIAVVRKVPVKELLALRTLPAHPEVVG